ncbi:MAG: NifB/NifX family molybdenum-iron cluster-binding protein [Oscillospiraceae bacterium]|nr:NifB/NifX family molybdenum-iron cluster-binding protein [Oscillospiraceae bacterium]
MRIAVTYENGNVYGHFGHTEQFKIYDIVGGIPADARVYPTNGSGHGALAGFLAEHGVDCLICGGIGPGAQAALAEAGITLYAGCSGEADQRVADLLAGTLAYTDGASCDHHHGGEGRSCGGHDHTCGRHRNG